MYCAYTIPGMTGSSLMYYYNGKAVRHSSIPSSLPFLLPPRGFGSQGKTRERERERARGRERERGKWREREKRKEERGRGRERRCEGEECRFYAPTSQRVGSPPRGKVRADCELCVRLPGVILGKNSSAVVYQGK